MTWSDKARELDRAATYDIKADFIIQSLPLLADAVEALRTARIECEAWCPNGIAPDRKCECSRSRIDAILAARSKQPEAEPVEVDEEREKADARVACPYPEFSPERWQFIQGWLACAKARRS